MIQHGPHVDLDERWSLASLVEAASDRHPDRIAVCDGSRAMTYSELDAATNRAANFIHQKGVTCGSRVGLVADRSIDVVVGLLAIVKAGAAYVPLDPSHPAERLSWMIEDAHVSVVLNAGPSGPLPPGVKRWDLSAALAHDDENRLAATAALDDLAYVMFTSGSTGRPKGVLVKQRGVVAYVLWLVAELGLGADDVVLQVVPYSFDPSVRDTFCTLVAGATLAIAPAYRDLGSDGVITFAASAGANAIISVVPSVLDQLVMAARAMSPAISLRVVGTCGEPLGAELARRTVETFGCRVLNQYGPTECTMVATAHWVDGAQRDPVPIGRPVGSKSVLLLGADGQPVADGSVGELYVGGPGIAVGYAARPDLTAQHFLVDIVPGAGRVYRTGDLARHMSDGVLEFVGRADQQVKLHGHRVEPGEIEQVLLTNPAVRQAAVVVRDGRLVAYVVGDASSDEDLRDRLRLTLPEYMVPAAIVRLDALPLTPNGKLDRHALHAPVKDLAGENQPVGAMERVVATVVAEVLGVALARDTSFFDAGGNSLLAVQLVALLYERYGLRISLRALFEQPTVAGIAAAATAADIADATEPAAPLPDQLPLTRAQQRLWLLHQLDDLGAAYTIGFVLRLQGPIDTARLATAWQDVVRHHGLLAYRLHADGDPAVLRRHPDVPELNIVEHAAVAIADLLADVGAFAFALEGGPLSRACLHRLAVEDHLLVVQCHHIIADGVTIEVLKRDLAAQYADAASSLTAVAGYDTYARWHDDWAAGPEAREALQRWTSRLDGIPHDLELPADRRRPLRARHRGCQIDFALDPDLWRRVEHTAAARGVTPFAWATGVFAGLMARLARQSDLVLGTVVSGRSAAAFVETPGLFATVVPIPVRTHRSTTFEMIGATIHDELIHALEDQNVPFDQIVSSVLQHRDLTRNPLVQVVFGFESPANPFAVPGVAADLYRPATGRSRFDLLVMMNPSGDGPHGFAEFDADLFDEWRVRATIAQFSRLLAASVEDPGGRIHAPSLVSDDESGTLLDFGRGPDVPLDEPCSLAGLFEAIADRCADRIAVRDPGKQLSYAELEAAANRVANFLIGRGVTTGSRIGLTVERTVDMVIGMLGIVKAGAAYVPLDPAYPAERLAWIIADAEVAAVLDAGSSSFLPDNVAVWPLANACLHGDARRPETRATLDTIAYVMFTSGSTGRPKGVLITQRGVAHLVAGATFAQLTPSDVMACISNPCFDAVTWEVWAPLLAGARIELFGRFDVLDLDSFGDTVRDRGVTAMFVTTALFRELMRRGIDLAFVPHLLTGGEAADPSSINSVIARGGTVTNAYGPTEATTYAVTYCIDTLLSEQLPVPLGRPIQNTIVFVLDEDGNLSPLGVPGELCIGGPRVAAGYAGRPDLTAERFVEHPVGRLYRTGDLARWTPEGLLEYLGREDQQVKLRGHRIELGEIEHALVNDPSVASGAAIVRNDDQLVGYVVPKVGASVDTAAVHARLKLTLPDYMLPAAIVCIDVLPVTANGKLDRCALPPPPDHLVVSEADVPAGPVEEMVAGAFADVLGLRAVSRTANFFDIGGSSLLAVQVVAILYERHGHRIALRSLFEHPTVADLAAVTPYEDVVHDLVEGELVPLGAGQSALWLLELTRPVSTLGSTFNISIAFRAAGQIDRERFAAALHDLVVQHPALRASIVDVDGRPWQRIADATECEPEVVEAPGAFASLDTARAWLAEQVRAPFVADEPPLIRAACCSLADGSDLVALSAHHMACDYQSLSIVGANLWERYTAPYRGIENDGFLDQIAHDLHRFTSEEIESQIGYWSEVLPDVSMAVLPPRMNTGGEEPRLLVRRFASDVRAVQEAAATLRLSPLALTMTAFALAMQQLAEQPWPLVVPTLVSQRTPTSDAAVGFLLSVLPVVLDEPLDVPVKTAMAVRNRLHEALANQDVPLFDLVTEIPEFGLTLLDDATAWTLFQYVPSRNTVTATAGDLNVAEFSLDSEGTQRDAVPVDLLVTVLEAAEGVLQSRIVFDRRRWTPEGAEALHEAISGHLAALVDAAR